MDKPEHNLDKPDYNQIIAYSWLALIALLSGYAYWQFYSYGDAGVASWYLPQTYHELLQTHSYWRLLTPSFIHFSEWHLISNLIIWLYFGRFIGQVSSGWFIFLTLCSAIISNSVQWWYGGALFGGLSGVASAVIGFLAINQWLRPQGIFFINMALVFIYFCYLLVVATGYFGVYSNAAHFVGLLLGIIIGYCFVKWSRLQRKTTEA